MIQIHKYHWPYSFISKLTLNLLVFFCFLASAKAQNPEQLFRVHIKDSTFYTGIITERVEEDYLMLVTLGGNETRIEFKNIIRVEEIEDTPTSDIYIYLATKAREKARALREAKRQSFVNGSRSKGYFALIQYCTGYAHWAVTTVHGYKVNQYSHLGLGAGIDGVLQPLAFGPSRFGKKYKNAEGMHFPVFAFIGGDLLTTRATPYYTLETGYAYVIPRESQIDLETRNISPHGFSVATSFGVKFNTHRKYHTNVGLKLTYRAREMTFRELILDTESNLYRLEFNKIMTSSWFLGLTVVQGF